MHRRAPAPRVDLHLEDGDHLLVGDVDLKVFHTPGHTPDSMSLWAGGRIFTGDTLMIGATGRADFAGGDPGAQYDSITQKLFALPDSTLVYPAHDYRGHTHSTIGDEKRANPRLAGRSRAAYVELMNNLGLPLPEKIQEALQANQNAIEDDSMKFPSVAKLNEVRQLAPEHVNTGRLNPDSMVLLDVREPDEYRGELGHIPGSILIPLRELAARSSELGPHKNKQIVAVCRAGVRSTTAAAMLTGLGFEQVSNLQGGMLDWNEQKLPIER
jgi:rhodanese-related sulfurtransferase